MGVKDELIAQLQIASRNMAVFAKAADHFNDTANIIFKDKDKGEEPNPQ